MTAGDLVHLFQKAADARRAERTAFKAYGGYSWGYVGGDLIAAAEEAEQRLQKGLEDFVDARIEIATGARP